MARVATAPVNTSNASLANYNAFCGAISAALQQLLSKTADTGQASFPVATIGTANAFRDYEIYRFNDTLQASSPVFLRVDYYNDTSLGLTRLFFRVGTGSDGAGNILNVHTGVATSASSIHNVSAAYTLPVLLSNGDGSQLVILQGAGSANPPTADNMAAFIIERFRNADGTPNGDGVMVWAWVNNAANGTNQINQWTRIFASSVGWIRDDANPIFVPWITGPVTAFSGSTATAFPFFTWGERQLRGPSQAVLYGYTGDWPRNSEVSVMHSGATKKFWSAGTAMVIALYQGSSALGGASARANFCPLFRYE